MGNLITAEQLGERLSLRPGTIKRWAQEGIIPCLRLSGKVVRFDPIEVEETLKHKAIEEREKTDRVREKQIAKLIETGTREDRQAIKHRDDGGLRLRQEVEKLERRAGL